MLDSIKKPINICLDYSLVYGGVVKAIEDFQTALGGRVLSFDDNRAKRVESEAIDYVDEHSKFLGQGHVRLSVAARRQAEERLDAASPELLICHSLFRGHCQWTRRQARSREIPYWAVPHGSLDPWVFEYGASFKRPWMKFAGTSYLRDAAAVVFATQREMEKARHIYDGKNARVVHWPVELLNLSQRESSREFVRVSLGLPPEARVLLYLGRYDGMKRPLETIEAFARARSANLHLVMVGNDSGLGVVDLEKQVARYSAEEQVHVVGPRFGADKNRMLLGADGFISLSHRENFGYTTAEALSAGIPVILSPGNDLALELEGQGCGWCLSSMDLDEASAAIETFAQASESDLRESGSRGRQWCENHLRLENFRNSLFNLY